MKTPLFGIAAIVFAIGCSPPAPKADGGAIATPATDGGVCCPLTVHAGCSPDRGYYGGWAPSAEECQVRGPYYDGLFFVPRTDDHGCEAVRADPMSVFGCNDIRSWDGGTGAGRGDVESTPTDANAGDD